MNCPQPNTIADLVEGDLPSAQLHELERHLDVCGKCAELVLVAVSSRGIGTQPNHSRGKALPPGTRLGRYEVRRWLGQGGMGDVYEGYDPELERRVAIKVLRDFGTESRTAQARLRREAKALARLAHPRVVAALDVGTYDERLFLVMELVEGPTVAAWLRGLPRTSRQILDVFLDAGEGLAAAHEVGIIHRDFKPQNVLLGRDDRARVSDFGLARSATSGEHESADEKADGTRAKTDPGDDPDKLIASTGPSRMLSLTQSGMLIGTPRYMAPEQVLRKPLDPRADQFSFCVSLFEALYGRHPFLDREGRPSVALSAENSQSAKPAIALGGKSKGGKGHDVPRAVVAALHRGLARHPEDRFPTMHALLAALRAARPSRAPRIIAGSIMGLALGAAILAFLALRGRSTPGPIPTVAVESEGRTADWSSARIVAAVPDRIHCIQEITPGTLRMMWGDPHRIEEIDLASGARRPSNLLPETYRRGCPQLSPDGHQLAFEGYDHDRPYIFHSPHPDGRDARPVVPCSIPTIDSEPLWLTDTEFVFDADFDHAAVYSLAKQTTQPMPPLENVGKMGIFRSVSQVAGRATIQVVTSSGFGQSLDVYAWPGLDLLGAFNLQRPAGSHWRFLASPFLLYGTVGELDDDRLVAYDVRDRRLASIASIPGRDAEMISALSGSESAIVTHRIESTIWYRGPQGENAVIPSHEAAVFRSPAFMTDGEIIMTRQKGDRWTVQLYRPSDGTLRDLTDGPDDYLVSPLPNMGWVVSRFSPTIGIVRYSGVDVPAGSRGQRIGSDEALQLAASPDGRYVAYIRSQLPSLGLCVMKLDDGTVTMLAPNAGTCQLTWSSPTTLWTVLLVRGDPEWTEIDVEKKAPTGRKAPASSMCLNSLPDPNPPFVESVRVVANQDWDVRLHAVPPPSGVADGVKAP